ncbi:MAG: HAD family hydrolase [Thermoprotei archaeon]|nr:MAG: HAD family hydrolase [Thermoprotei archaeon]
MRLKPEFRRFRAFLLDCDGVLWLGGRPLHSAVRAVAALREAGRAVLYVTNNSTRSRRGYVERLRRMGFSAEVGEVFCSSYVTARYLEGRAERVFVVGEAGLVEELAARGLEVLGLDPDERADCVVVGLDRGLTYEKLAVALGHLRRGALFVATNRDSTLPSEAGELPGAGAIVAALEEAAGRRVDVEVGKPSPLIFEAALEEWGLNRDEVLVVGDRLDTDVEGARRAGLTSALVLTGVTKPEDLEGRGGPDYVLRTLLDLFE